MTKEYKSIACGLYDELELRALRKSKVFLAFKENSGEVKTINCVITDLFSKEKTEYLKTDTELIIRLDDLVAVDNITFKDYC